MTEAVFVKATGFGPAEPSAQAAPATHAEQPRKLVPLAAAAASLLIPLLAAWAMSGGSGPSSPEQLAEPQTWPTHTPMALKPVSRAQAVSLNAAIPFTREPNVPARPYKFAGSDEAQARALECLTAAVYHEAASEGREGQQAVAQTILNRVRHPAFPAGICEVVFEGSTRDTGCQFSFTCDGALTRVAVPRLWMQARTIAWDALNGVVYAPVGLATHYHAEYVLPYWATSLTKNAQVGLHIFYRWPGKWSQPAAFHQRHSRELDPSDLRASALMADGVWPYRPAASRKRVITGARADPDLELAGVISLIASAPTPGEGRYARAARDFFAGHAGHPAVRMLAGNPVKAAAQEATLPGPAAFVLASAPIGAAKAPIVPRALPRPVPVTAALGPAARDFARESRFASFFQSQRGLYEQAAREAGAAASSAAYLWESYTRSAVESRDLRLVLGPVDDASTCVAEHLGARTPTFLQWSPGSRTPGAADVFIAAGLANGVLGPKLRSGLEGQVVRAVFVRIETLRSGAKAGRRALEREVAQGHRLVPLLAARLQAYERSQADFAGLREFLPKLLAGLPATSQDPSGAVARRHPACQTL